MITYNTKSVREGLILHIDAANKKCYPGSGTIATDLSGNGKNGTFGGGTTYSTMNGGKFTFDGINSYITFGTGNTVFPAERLTTEFMFRSTGTTPTTGTTPCLCGLTFGYDVYMDNMAIYTSIDNGIGFTATNITGLTGVYSGGWNHLMITDSGNSRNVYLNGVLKTTISATWLGVTRWMTNSANIGRSNNNSNLFFTGDISVFKMYSRDLSASEVLQNFNSLRGRYGL